VSLIELTPDMKRANAALERIATALESLLLHEYGVTTVAKPSLLERIASPTGAVDVGYASDETTLRQELEALAMPATVRERDGDIVSEEVGEDVLGTHRRT
jgi:hypothetical protein